jgi:N-acetylmuramoyl-L-alanine amidase
MKRLFSLFCAILLVFSVSMTSFAETETNPDIESSTVPMRGLLVKAQGNLDFPSAPNLSAKALRSEIKEIVSYAKDAGYNAIFLEVRADGGVLYSSSVFPTSQYFVKKQGAFTFFDPLREVLKAAQKENIDVYAVIDPYGLGDDLSVLSKSNPASKNTSLAIQSTDNTYLLDPSQEETITLNARDIGKIASKYKTLAGIVLENLLPTDDENAAAALLESVTASVGGKTKVGAFLPDDALEEAVSFSKSLDVVFPQITLSTGFDEENYASRLSLWQDSASWAVAPLIDAVRSEDSAEELTAKVFVAEQSDTFGTVCGSYRFLSGNENFTGSLIASTRNDSDAEIFSVDYNPPQKLTITRPSSTLTTDYSAYFIMGTSNPDVSLTMDGETIDRQTSDGVFGVLVSLASGTNVFTFQNGSDVETVRIVRSSGSGGSAATTTKVTSMTPRNSAIVENGETLTLSCIAPANTTVTATLGNKTVLMNQKAVASTGIPATFTGEVTVSGAADGQVLDLGPITYTIVEYGSTFTSNGNVYVTGDGAVPTVTVNTTSASVYYDDSVTEGSFKAIYKTGVTDRVLSSMGEYYELSSGWIKKSDVDVNASDAPVSVTVSAVVTDHDEKAERFVFRGATGLPYTFEDREDGSILLTLYGITMPAQVDTTSEIFSSITWENHDDGTVTGLFVPASGSVWAMDVFPSEDGTIVYVRRTPTLSDDVSQPLRGISIVLDPGHGGNDSGAISVTGGKESDLNFADATMLQYRLEQLGAEVTLTRTAADDTKSLYERVGVGQQVLPDFFLALHHNSIVEYADGYKHSGVEAYYYEDFGKAIASAAVTHISQANYDRDYRNYEWGYYIVAKNRFAPSILCEIGFVPNPVENRYISDETEIYKTANAFCAAILEVIDNANNSQETNTQQ